MKKITLKKSTFELVRTGRGQFRIDYERELNPAQLEAVEIVDGPVLVIAGAGTGKTRTLTYRVARLIETGLHPESILLLTFTRKAAREMLRRAALLLDDRTERVAGGTFHSFAVSILRRHAERLKYERSFTILDQGDSEDVINLLRTRGGFAGRKKRFPRKATLRAIFSSMMTTLTPLDVVLARDYPHFTELHDDIAALGQAYLGYKMKYSLMDYDDLLVNLVRLLESDTELREKLSRDYRYIMVDEYQDTNAIQARIVQLLGSHGNVMAVGDDSQSIYSFRGANFRNIMDFPKAFPGTRIVTLEENYRSTQPILDLTNEIIVRASEKYQKQLFTNKQKGPAPAIIATENENMQSLFVVQRVLELREEGIPLSEIAVLFRAGYLSFDLEIELGKANVPFVKFGGIKFMETAHVKDIVAHLRVLENPRDVVSWHRILLLLEGVGPRTAQRVTDEIMEGRLSLGPRATERLGQIVRNKKILDLFEMLESIRSDATAPPDKAAVILEHYRPILKDKYDDFHKRLKDLDMFLEIAERYRSLQSLLTDLALEPPNESVADLEEEGKEREFLTLSTVHSAKGLEWHSVFVIHVLDGRFPMAASVRSDAEMEEERRLLYVACTRAKQNLYLLYPTYMYDRSTGMVLSKPSRFLDGISGNFLESFTLEVEE